MEAKSKIEIPEVVEMADKFDKAMRATITERVEKYGRSCCQRSAPYYAHYTSGYSDGISDAIVEMRKIMLDFKQKWEVKNN